MISVEVASAIRDRGLPTRVLLLSVHDHPQYVVEGVHVA